MEMEVWCEGRAQCAQSGAAKIGGLRYMLHSHMAPLQLVESKARLAESRIYMFHGLGQSAAHLDLFRYNHVTQIALVNK